LTLKLSKSSVAGTAPAYQSAGTTGGHRSGLKAALSQARVFIR
jgi:hypothetical protein